ncbi:uncharacterized protein BDZ99DRAFT_441037 [Mytilinidion resinicola]|uniref:RAI1-like domain-containing protein n=1 Tax=Mytilinidion resinicola TaxID=574789 RepID=A0A6A6YVH5_9PEZI|nr:uncharacterized protein BDZ99DRAFT_441037 [Mytilinidion resinicola]KAF2811985.1 hypothetical protein BDZ99DRAFT_441037 [Mytilinidion resinicola]
MASESRASAPKISKITSIPLRNKKKPTAASKTAWMLKGTGEVVRTIASASLEADDATVSSELSFELLCSYNWQRNRKAILVPGGPPKWVLPPLPITLAPDAGLQFVDQNAFRVPRYPFEPAFQALAVMSPNAQLDDVDIIANRNSLRKLLNFAAGRRQDPFRMDLHMVKDTLFISRKERNARFMIHGALNSGYGHSFEQAFTRPEDGLDDSSSHHRVIRYRLGDLNCVVRFEVDAYYEDTGDPDVANSMQQPIDQAITMMAQRAVKNPLPSAIPKGTTKVIIKAKKAEKLNDAMPQLWFGRTRYLLTGKHVNGVFRSISTSHVEPKFTNWEMVNQENLRKLVGLLADLKRIVRETKRGAAMLLCESKGAPLRVLEAKSERSALPEEMIMKHWSFGRGDVK